MTTYRNISFATVDMLETLLEHGSLVTVRGSVTKEVIHSFATLERPLERYVFIPRRNNDVFAQVAEALWVLAGRNDIGWLSHYLWRAREFSDDGIVWRGGYGPRLRRWHEGVDQLDEVRRLLLADPTTRQAVVVLFDPSIDYTDSKDIPCNNWLSFIARDGRLHLSVAVRSNDILWGFSGVNAFQWSVLHEMMASWTGNDVGNASYFATSFHLYQPHFRRAQEIVKNFHGMTPYDYSIGASRFSTDWKNFDQSLNRWFSLEATIRQDPEATWSKEELDDPFLLGCLQLIRLKWGAPLWDDKRLARELAALRECDWLAAAYEHFGRSRPAIVEHIPHPGIRRFFERCRPEDL